MSLHNIILERNGCDEEGIEDNLPGIIDYRYRITTKDSNGIYNIPVEKYQQQDWREEHELGEGIFCKDYDCKVWASSGACNIDVTSAQFANCRHTSKGPIKEFCKKSCRNCGRHICSIFYIC